MLLQGIQHISPLEDFPPEQWDRIIAINLTSCFHTMRLAIPHMREKVSFSCQKSVCSRTSYFKTALPFDEHSVSTVSRNIDYDERSDVVLRHTPIYSGLYTQCSCVCRNGAGLLTFRPCTGRWHRSTRLHMVNNSANISGLSASSYCRCRVVAAKHGLNGMSKVAALEVRSIVSSWADRDQQALSLKETFPLPLSRNDLSLSLSRNDLSLSLSLVTTSRNDLSLVTTSLSPVG